MGKNSSVSIAEINMITLINKISHVFPLELNKHEVTLKHDFSDQAHKNRQVKS